MNTLSSAVCLVVLAGCANTTVADDDAGIPELDSSTKDSATAKDSSVRDAAGQDGATDGGGDASMVEAGPDSGGLAVVQINEVNPNLASGLVELYVTTGGSTKGITIEENITGMVLLETLPDIPAATGDIIVVHLNAPTVTDETATQTDCVVAACYSGAWDVKGATVAIAYNGHVILARDPSSNIQDGVPFYRKGAAEPVNWHSDVEALQTASAWLPVDCGGVACSTNALAQTVSVDWAGCGAIRTGNSVARITNGNTKKAADWKVGASSFGATNP